MRNYCNIDDKNKEHIKFLINWLYDEVISAGGDGDALWYSEYFHVDEILPLVKELNIKFKWEIEKKDECISIGENQEWILITNNKIYWDDAPSWQQVKIHY